MKLLPFTDKYAITKSGRVWSVASKIWLRPNTNAHGYPYVSLQLRRGKGGGRSYTVHVLVALTYLGPRPHGYDVDHKNRDRADPRLSNLRYLPQDVNRRTVTTLTVRDIEKIKVAINRGDRSTDIACRSGVHTSQITLIRQKVDWESCLVGWEPTPARVRLNS